MMFPALTLFASTLILGTIIALSSTTWVYTWAGLELNLLSMVPILASQSFFQETEAAIKYFLVQTIGSALLLVSTSLTSLMYMSTLTTYFMTIMFITSVMLKMGAAPTHWWLPSIMSSISWAQCALIATWQKIAPIAIFSSTSLYSALTMVIVSFAALSAIVGGIGGMNQSQLRTLLAYSSIGHLGWMVMAATVNSYVMWMYFIVYSTINLSIMLSMKTVKVMMSSITSMLNKLSATKFLLIMIMLLSLGGLPPLLGFVPKWMMVDVMSQMDMIIITFMLILGSLLNLFYYLNMAFNFFISPSSTHPEVKNIYILMPVMTSVSSMPLMIFM